MATAKHSKTATTKLRKPTAAALEKAARKVHPEVKRYIAELVESINTPKPDMRKLDDAIDLNALRAQNPLIQTFSIEDSMEVTMQALLALKFLAFEAESELHLSDDERQGGRHLMEVAMHALKLQTDAMHKVLRAVPLSAMPAPAETTPAVEVMS